MLDREAITELCRRHDVSRLAVFGAVSSHFDAERSDVDFLVEFAGGSPTLVSSNLVTSWIG